jgi:hypothetical protein
MGSVASTLLETLDLVGILNDASNSSQLESSHGHHDEIAEDNNLKVTRTLEFRDF